MTEKSRSTHLKRRLTSPQVAMIALSGALGTGLFLGSGSTISFAGPATIISYVLAGSLALTVVFALAEMVSVHPVPGGHGAIAAEHLGKLGGYIARWNFSVTWLTAVGAEVTATATYLQHWFPNLSLGLGTVLCSLFIIGLNMATVRLYGSSEYWFSMIKVTAIVVFILLGLSVIFFGWPSPHGAIGFSNLSAHGGFAPMGVTGILLAACMAVFSFGGIENVSVSAAESEHPERDIPRATSTMIWRLLIFYVLATFVIVTLQPWTATVAASGNADSSPFVVVLELVGIPIAGHIMNAILIVAALSAANGCLYAASRMIHSLATDGMAPHFAAYTSKQGAPRGAVIIATICFVIASALSILSPDKAFMYLYGCATVGILINWVVIMLTHLRFRAHWKQQHTDDERPPAFLRGAPVINIVVIVASAAIFITLLKLMPVAWIAGIPYICILFISFAILHKVRDLPDPQPLVKLQNSSERN